MPQEAFIAFAQARCGRHCRRGCLRLSFNRNQFLAALSLHFGLLLAPVGNEFDLVEDELAVKEPGFPLEAYTIRNSDEEPGRATDG